MADGAEYARVTTKCARECALKFMEGRPSLVGEVALAIGSLWPLAETEKLLDGLVRQGLATCEVAASSRTSVEPLVV